MATSKAQLKTGPARDTLLKAKATVFGVRNTDYPEPKTSGIKTRGNGAATKGVTARGPMA